MAVLADVTLPGGMTACRVYIAPKYISANRDAGHYALEYRIEKGGAELPVPPEFSIVEFALGGLARPDRPSRAGVVYDRNKPAHEQVYADLREKLKAGQVPWLGNVRNEDGSPFVGPDAEFVA